MNEDKDLRNALLFMAVLTIAMVIGSSVTSCNEARIAEARARVGSR